MNKRVISILLAVVMVFAMIPLTVFANESEYVYISVSYDDKFIEDKNGKLIAYVPVSFEELASVNLDDYELSDYWYDEDGDGAPEVTALQLIIYAHEELYGGDFSQVSFTGTPGSTYFAGGLFGHDENLNYYLNGQYPLASAGWGATSDQIVLEAGDVISLAGFTSWDFYADSAFGFNFFADGEGKMTHKYTANAGEACSINLIKGTKDYDYNSVFVDVPYYDVHYGKNLYEEEGTVTTDDNGCASVTFPTGGTWYLWTDGGYGNEFPDSIVSAPGYAEVAVRGEDDLFFNVDLSECDDTVDCVILALDYDNEENVYDNVIMGGENKAVSFLHDDYDQYIVSLCSPSNNEKIIGWNVNGTDYLMEDSASVDDYWDFGNAGVGYNFDTVEPAFNEFYLILGFNNELGENVVNDAAGSWNIKPVIATSTENPALQYGDVNKDERIDGMDLIELRSGILNGTMTEEFFDPNGDGTLDARDLVKLKKYVAGIVDKLGK